MIELSQLTVIVVGELLLGLILFSFFLIGRGIVKKNRLRKASRHLVERIEGDKLSRTNRLRSRLDEYYGYAGEELEQAVHDLTQSELRLYQNIINSYLKQDAIAFQQSDVDVENLVAAYQQLNLPERVDTTEQSDETSGEIKRLEEENERLSEELRVTMDTMGHMLNEYSSMFEMSLQAKEGEPQLSSIQDAGMDQNESVPEQKGAVDEGFEGINEEATLTGESIGVEADEPQAEVAATGAESGREIDMLQLERDEGVTVRDSGSAEPELREDDGQDGITAFGEELSAVAGEPGQEPILESVDDLAKGENSLMDELEPVDIYMPNAEEQLTESVSPEGESLEEEWARLLEEDADSAESLDDEAVLQKNRAP